MTNKKQKNTSKNASINTKKYKERKNTKNIHIKICLKKTNKNKENT